MRVIFCFFILLSASSYGRHRSGKAIAALGPWLKTGVVSKSIYKIHSAKLNYTESYLIHRKMISQVQTEIDFLAREDDPDKLQITYFEREKKVLSLRLLALVKREHDGKLEELWKEFIPFSDFDNEYEHLWPLIKDIDQMPFELIRPLSSLEKYTHARYSFAVFAHAWSKSKGKEVSIDKLYKLSDQISAHIEDNPGPLKAQDFLLQEDKKDDLKAWPYYSYLRYRFRPFGFIDFANSALAFGAGYLIFSDKEKEEKN